MTSKPPEVSNTPKQADVKRAKKVAEELILLRTHLVEIQATREVSIAITKIDEAFLWLNAFLSREV